MKKKTILLIFVSSFFSCVPKKPIYEKIISDVKYSGESLMNGENIYGNKCGQCHDLYNPKDFSTEKWKPILNRMSKKANLTDEEKNDVFIYISFENR